LLSLSPIFTEDHRTLIAGVAHDLREQKHQQQVIQEAYDSLQTATRQLEELNFQLEKKVQARTRTLSDAYRQLEKQNKLLQMLDQLKTDFVSMVSHELRNPLTSLNGGLELLLKQKGRSGADRKTLTLMRQEVNRLTVFVENILHLSAVEAGRINIHLTSVSLPAVAREVCLHLAPVGQAKRIQVDLEADTPEVFADETILHSILNHLIDNAIKYAPEGPIILDAIRIKNKLRIRVIDNGPGIPVEKRSLLFQRFQRLDVKDSQSVYGHGLGLYLCREMLRAMKSDLVFMNSPEGGACFYFDLKVA
jgi:signal transduction histidine kinase